MEIKWKGAERDLWLGRGSCVVNSAHLILPAHESPEIICLDIQKGLIPIHYNQCVFSQHLAYWLLLHIDLPFVQSLALNIHCLMSLLTGIDLVGWSVSVCQCLLGGTDLGSVLRSAMEMNAPCISNPGAVLSHSLWSAAWVVLGCQGCSGHSGDWKWQCIWVPKWVRPLPVASPLNNGWVQLWLHHVCVMEGNRQSPLPVCFAFTYKTSCASYLQSDLKQ